MVLVIIKRECQGLIRDARFWVATSVLLVLLTISLYTARQNIETLNKERKAAQDASRDHWLNQSPKNPHAAAHFGNFAFRLQTPLTLFDDGLNIYTGTYVFLEPHKQNDFKFSQAQDTTGISRFSHLTPAFILQTLLPLLIILLCFESVTKEKENNTLKLVVSQGGSIQKVVVGKVFGNFIPIAITILFFFSITGFGLASLTEFNSTLWQRLQLVFVCYLIYTFVFISIAVVVSAFSDTARSSLMKLIGIWILACVVLPKVSSNIGENLYRTPSQLQFSESVHADELNGLNGHDPYDKRRKALLRSTLAKYQVDTITKLPVNFDAVAMIESEKYTTMVYRKRYAEVEDLFQKQNALSEWCGSINPFQAIQYSSMALCETDYSHFKDFHAQAEKYRLYFVNAMNEFMSTHTQSGDWSTTFGKELYQTIHPFEYISPSASWSIAQQPVSLALLVYWLIVSFILVYSTRKIAILT